MFFEHSMWDISSLKEKKGSVIAHISIQGTIRQKKKCHDWKKVTYYLDSTPRETQVPKKSDLKNVRLSCSKIAKSAVFAFFCTGKCVRWD